MSTPVQSTWPRTKWPPMRPSGRIGRSRLTSAPRLKPPSVVTRAVSGPISVVERRRVCADDRQADAVDGDAVAVVQLAARSVSIDEPVAALDRGRAPRPGPTCSISPVNIAFDDDVGPARLRLKPATRPTHGRRGSRPPMVLRPRPAREGSRPGAPRRPGPARQRAACSVGAAFDQQRLDAQRQQGAAARRSGCLRSRWRPARAGRFERSRTRSAWRAASRSVATT